MTDKQSVIETDYGLFRNYCSVSACNCNMTVQAFLYSNATRGVVDSRTGKQFIPEGEILKPVQYLKKQQEEKEKYQ